jgi:hypothetical protein
MSSPNRALLINSNCSFDGGGWDGNCGTSGEPSEAENGKLGEEEKETEEKGEGHLAMDEVRSCK